MFDGDTLLATVDQQTASGVATGTAQTRYIHPDHLGSTNVVTDQNDNLVQTLDYYPYGSTRISVAMSTNEKRKYIGQFTDDSGLDYLNARGAETAYAPKMMACHPKLRPQLFPNRQSPAS